MEGVTDAQARQMAEDLEFKGPARNEVRCVYLKLFKCYVHSLYGHVSCNPLIWSCECHVTFFIWLCAIGGQKHATKWCLLLLPW